jgi:hypothetical protein
VGRTAVASATQRVHRMAGWLVGCESCRGVASAGRPGGAVGSPLLLPHQGPVNMYTLKTCSNSCRLSPLLRLPDLLREGVVGRTVSLWSGAGRNHVLVGRVGPAVDAAPCRPFCAGPSPSCHMAPVCGAAALCRAEVGACCLCRGALLHGCVDFVELECSHRGS